MIDVVWRAIERAKIHLDMCEGMILAHPKELVGLPAERRSFNCRKFPIAAPRDFFSSEDPPLLLSGLYVLMAFSRSGS